MEDKTLGIVVGEGGCSMPPSGKWWNFRGQLTAFLPQRGKMGLSLALKKKILPQLVWLSGLSAGLQTKGSLVRFPVRACAWVVGQVPSRGACERQPHTDVSLPLFLLPFPSP